MKLELRNITKKFGNFAANEDISLTVDPGEIVALLGENGAGKSTLMNVVYGLLQPTSGEIYVNDERAQFDGPGEAIAAGIGMVHQHFMLIPPFTVAENVMLGNEHTKGIFLDLETARTEVRRVSEAYNLHVDPDALVEDLPVGVQQRVEIIKALVRDAGCSFWTSRPRCSLRRKPMNCSPSCGICGRRAPASCSSPTNCVKCVPPLTASW